MKLAWIALSVVFLCAAPAQAEIRVVSSVEWKAVNAPLIVRAKVAAMKDATAVHAGVSLRDVTLEVEEVLKGAIEGKALACRVPGQGAVAADPWVAWKTSGHPVLLFLRRVQDGEGRPDLVGHWSLYDHTSAIDLAEPKDVYTADMTFAKGPEEILAIVSRYALWEGPRPASASPTLMDSQAGFLRFEIPTDAEIFRGVYSGSACFIIVPAEEKYRELALTLACSADVGQRMRGADMLRNYPGHKTLKVLNDLLKDPVEVLGGGASDDHVRVRYPVREVAHSALVGLGLEFEKPAVLWREPTIIERRTAREKYWNDQMRAVMLPKDWVVRLITSVSEPAGWKRTGGGEGLAVECENPAVSIKVNWLQSRHPRFTFYVMPVDWEGENRQVAGETVTAAGHVVPSPIPSSVASPSFYLGQTDHFRAFATTSGHDGWNDPFTQALAAFGLRGAKRP